MSKISTLRLALSMCLIMATSSLWSHSTGGYFVTNGVDCYLVITNWHGDSQQQGTIDNTMDGIFVDLNQDGFFDSNSNPIGNGAPGPLNNDTEEFVMFSDWIDLTDAPSGTLLATTWKTEVDAWFLNEFGPGFVSSLVWEPTCSNTTYAALVAKIDCPTVNGMYDAAVATGSVVSTPCSTPVFQLDFTNVDFTPAPAEDLPLFGLKGMLFLLLSVVSVGAFVLYRKF